MTGATEGARGSIARTSITMPHELLGQLDAYTASRGHQNRSQALAEIVRNAMAAHRFEVGVELMAGSITLFVDDGKEGVSTRVRKTQRRYIDEVIGSFGVQLEDDKRMEVLVVQGPARRLNELVAALVRIRGVETGTLSLTNAVLPPIHQRPRAYKEPK